MFSPLFSYKKAQSLPLNTIVIAVLVIIVLLVIIVFFTSNVGESGETISQTSPGACSINNPAIKTLGYLHAEYSTGTADSCSHSAFEVISIIPRSSGEETICGTPVPEGYVCCGTKTPNTWNCNN